MYKKLKDRSGAGALAVAVVALVAAFSVPAVAQPVASVSNALAKQVKQALNLGKAANKRSANALKLARQANNNAGQPGPAGAQGPPGPAGPQGAKGDPGDDGVGIQGPDGKSVVIVNEAPANCLEGGFTYEVDGSGELNEVCNGEQGSSGDEGPQGPPGPFIDTLPAGKTLVGHWSVGPFTATGAGQDSPWTPISFGIPLDATMLNASPYFGLKVVGMAVGAAATADCPGSNTNPQAAPGVLCLYSANVTAQLAGGENLQAFGTCVPGGACTHGFNQGPRGVVIKRSSTAAGPAGARGTWAVTAPVPVP